GNDIGGTTILASPATLRGCRLVASSRSSGHALTRVTARTAQASSRCSQLSSTSSSRLPARYSASDDSDRPAEKSCTPSALKAAWATSNGSWMDASSTSQAPSGNPRDICAAARSASRGLSDPPAAGEGQQPGGGQQPFDFAKLRPASDKAGQIGRQVRPSAPAGSAPHLRGQGTPSAPGGEASYDWT